MSKLIILAQMRSGTHYLCKKVEGLQAFDDWKYTPTYAEQIREAHAEQDMMLFRFHYIPSEYPTNALDRDLSSQKSNYWWLVQDLISREDVVVLHVRESVFDMTLSRIIWDSYEREKPMHVDLDNFKVRYNMNALFSEMFFYFWRNDSKIRDYRLFLSSYEGLEKGETPFYYYPGEPFPVTDEKWKPNDYSKLITNYDEVMTLKKTLEGGT